MTFYYDAVYGAVWEAYVINVTGGDQLVASVGIKAYRVGNPGTLNLYLKNGPHPVGSNIATGTIDANTFTTDITGTWYYINLSTSTVLLDGNAYDVILSAPSGDILNYVGWRFN